MRGLWRRLAAWLDYLVPTDERLAADTAELRAFAKRVKERDTRSQAGVLPLSHKRTQS